MGGDYTRVRFDATKSYTGVHQQQGRVGLDADFNEFEEILDRRGRALAYDTMGRAVVPVTTEHGFEIGLDGTGALLIGPGRAYVDGIVTECFGASTATDPVLGGVRGQTSVAYTKQPFRSTALPAPSTPPGTFDLIYLDVWQREVTVTEDGGLLEPALGGPDTTTRVQTAWQVKVLADAGAQACATDTAKWRDLTAPSTGTLTAVAHQPPPPGTGPCIINPVGGYTGLENRLYRVEIVQALPPKFVWSRDNGSIAATVTKATDSSTAGQTRTTLTVSSIGRDGFHRFTKPGYLQFVDDDIEFGMRLTGGAGPIFVINHIDEGADTIEIIGALPHALNTDWHPRIRRWEAGDQAAAGTVPLGDDGIDITFGAGKFHAGDHWVFPARTATGEIVGFRNAAPHGVLHHFAKLAVVEVGNPEPKDCRVMWPAECDCGDGCGISVAPGEDIQKAIDSLTGTGGSVCLRMGVHQIARPLSIAQSDITLHAEAPWVTVRSTSKNAGVLGIGGGDRLRNVIVSGIRFESAGAGDAMVKVSGVDGGHLDRCAFVSTGERRPAAGVLLNGCVGFTVEGSLLTGCSMGLFGEQNQRIVIRDNRLDAAADVIGGAADGTFGVRINDPDAVEVLGNEIAHYPTAVSLGVETQDIEDWRVGCRIAGNTIQHGGLKAQKETIFAVIVATARCDIVGNEIVLSLPFHGGILTVDGDTCVARNQIRNAGDPLGEPKEQLPVGFEHRSIGDLDSSCVVRENLFTGAMRAVRAVGGTLTPDDALNLPVRRVDVVRNRILGSVKLFDLHPTDGEAKDELGQALLYPTIQLQLVGAAAARIAENKIDTVIAAIVADWSAGIQAVANTIVRCQSAIVFNGAPGSQAIDNVIRQASVGLLVEGSDGAVLDGNTVTDATEAVRSTGGRHLRVMNNIVRGGATGIDLFQEASATVAGNVVEGAYAAGIACTETTGGLTVERNEVRNCGFHLVNEPGIATGIRVDVAADMVIVDGCDVSGIGDAPDGTAHPGTRISIRVETLALRSRSRVRVHNCRVRNTVAGARDPFSRALLVLAPSQGDLPAQVDVTDNIFEQSGELANRTSAVMVQVGNPNLLPEVMFSLNNCADLASNSQGPVVFLFATNPTVTGNRIRAGVQAALRIVTPGGRGPLTATGNVSTGGADIHGTPIPQPYVDFNINA